MELEDEDQPGVMMRILNLMLAKGRGGLETMAVRYHQALTAQGMEVLSLGHPNGELARNLDTNAFRPLNAHFNNDPFAALALRRVADGFKPDLILCHGNRAINLGGSPFSGTAAQCIAIVHNFRFKRDISKVKAALAVSHAVARALNQAYPGLSVRTMANFGPMQARPVKPPPTGVPVIGTLGSLHTNKGLDVLLEALALLKHDQGIAFRLKIAGDGHERSALENQIAHLELKPEVEFYGWVTQTADYLSTLDLFVSASRVEPFGLVVAEAMAAGVPVVSTDIDGPQEILRSGTHQTLGHLCRPEDATDLAQAIESTLGDWSDSLVRAEHAQKTALETYSLEAGASRLTQILRAI